MQPEEAVPVSQLESLRAEWTLVLWHQFTQHSLPVDEHTGVLGSKTYILFAAVVILTCSLLGHKSFELGLVWKQLDIFLLSGGVV